MLVQWAVWSLAISGVYLLVVAAAAIGMALRAGGRREETITSDDTRAVSRFTIPVSLVVVVDRGRHDLTSTIAALLAINYPEFEVIIVVDGRRGGIDALVLEWQLQAHEFFFRRSLVTAAVRRIYRSGRDERLVVLDVPSSGRADAYNAALNLARYRYVATLPPGVTFDQNALLRVMAAPMRDPSTIVAASAHLERTDALAGLASMRATAASRLVWRHLPCSPAPRDSVNVWRRDAVLEAGGFSAAALDVDLDLSRRIVMDGRGRAGRFYRSADYFGQVRGQSHHGFTRWLASLQFATVLRPSGIRAFGLKSLFVFFNIEVCVPLAEVWLTAGTIGGAASGAWPWSVPLMALAFLAIGNATVTTAALLTRGSGLAAPEGAALKRLLILAPFEPLLRIVRP